LGLPLNNFLTPFDQLRRMEILASGDEAMNPRHTFLLTRTASARLPAMAARNANMNAAHGENDLATVPAPRMVERTSVRNGNRDVIGAIVWKIRLMDLDEDMMAIRRAVCPLRLLVVLLRLDHVQNEKETVGVKRLLKG